MYEPSCRYRVFRWQYLTWSSSNGRIYECTIYLREKQRMVSSYFLVSDSPGSHSMGRTSECNIFNKNQNHSSLLKACTIVIFCLLRCLCATMYLVWFQVDTGVCTKVIGRKQSCRNEKNHWIDCSDWYFISLKLRMPVVTEQGKWLSPL